MKNASVKVSDGLYQQIREYAESVEMSISDVFRRAVEQLMTDEAQSNHAVEPSNPIVEPAMTALTGQLTEKDKQLSEKDKQLVAKDKQLEEKDTQISELHQLLAIQSKTTAQLTSQLDVIKQLEDMRQPASWWGRLFRK